MVVWVYLRYLVDIVYVKNKDWKGEVFEDYLIFLYFYYFREGFRVYWECLNYGSGKRVIKRGIMIECYVLVLGL